MIKMKQSLLTILSSLLFTLTLTGCGQTSRTAADKAAWPEDWVVIGNSLGIEPPGNGLTLLDNKDALSASDLYYAAWSIGEKTDYINEEEKTTDLYDAQLYLLMMDCKTDDEAASNAAEWKSAEEKIYQITETKTVTCSGESFTLLIYDVDREGNPYSHGASAFGTYKNHAVTVELSCQEHFTGNAADILTDFLKGVHFS